MQLEKQVCSLELSKRLKELGVKQESLWEWGCWGTLSGMQYNKIVLRNRFPTYCSADQDCAFYPAFTAAELGEMLPEFKENGIWVLESRKQAGGWQICYLSDNDTIIYRHWSETEADARAKMLIYLLKNKMISNE